MSTMYNRMNNRVPMFGSVAPIRPPRAPQPKTTLDMRTSLHAERAHQSYTHNIQGDLAPGTGRVHLVSRGPHTGDESENHILTQLDADANMGAKRLVERSRRGPFKSSSGPSRLMDRSAHVSYRRRGRTLEITVSRGVTEHEMETLLGKLGAHRIGTNGSLLFVIKGGSRKKFGSLDRVDMSKLRDMLYKCLEKYRVAGLLVVDTKERGTLHKGYSHSMGMKEAYRKSDFGSK